MSNRRGEVDTWAEFLRRLRLRFLPPEGEMKVVGQWRKLQQTGTVAAYSDYIYRLQAMCPMHEHADFRLAFYGLRPELQGEVRKYMRLRELHVLPLETLFTVAADAELGLGRQRGERNERDRGERNEDGRRVPAGTGGSCGTGPRPRLTQLETVGTGPGGGGSSSVAGMGGRELARGTNWNEGRSRTSGPSREGRQIQPETRSREACAVCDGFGHGWMSCPRKKPGRGCARCGSTAHRLRNCPQRRNAPPGNRSREDLVGTSSTRSGEWGRESEDAWGHGGQGRAAGHSTDDLLLYQLGVSLPCPVAGLPRTQLLFYEVKCSRKTVRALLDSGATVNALATRVVDRVGGSITGQPESVRLANGEQVKSEGVAKITVQRKGYSALVTCVVITELGVDLLLGRPWLEEWNPTIDWVSGRLTFSDGVVWTPVKTEREESLGSALSTLRMSERRKREVYRENIEGGGDDRNINDLPIVVERYRDVFEEPKGCEKGTPLVTHRLKVQQGIDPIRKVPYRMAPVQKVALAQELEQFLDKGWIRPSRSPWATVALVVPKKDRTWRVCIDYRDLNTVTQMDAYPLPKIDELLNRLAAARIFSKVDLHSGFHQIPMDTQSIPYTAFRIPDPIRGCSHFEWTVMPMGLSTAPPTFQRWMEHSLQGMEAYTLVYLDDVLIHSPDPETHNLHLEEVFRRFREKGMKLKEKKCVFALTEVPFLGHLVGNGQIKVDENKLGRLKEWTPPLKGVKEVRSLMGFMSYYRAFIPHFAEITAPLTELLKKSKGWGWTEEATSAVIEGKRRLAEARARYAWDPARGDRVTTDASDVGLGAVFEQKVEGVGWAPVAFWSRKLSGAEKNYSATDKEWLAVVEAVTRHWRHWLVGRSFVLRSDHAALRQLLRTKGEQFSARQARWSERLSEFAFEFEHVPGPSNAAADALSRAPVTVVSALELCEGTKAVLKAEEIEEAARQDDAYQQECQRLGVNSEWVPDGQGLLRDSTGRTKVPNLEALRIKLILEAHEPPFCGHLGVKRTLARLREAWVWDSMARDVESVVRSCDVCQKDASRYERDKAPLVTIIASQPWEVVTMDFLCGLAPSSPGKWTGCVVACDRFTRMMYVKECSGSPNCRRRGQTAYLPGDISARNPHQTHHRSRHAIRKCAVDRGAAESWKRRSRWRRRTILKPMDSPNGLIARSCR